MRSQQQEEAHVSVCLVAGDTGPSLYMAVKLAIYVTFDKRGGGEGKVTRTYAHLEEIARTDGEEMRGSWYSFFRETADLASL